MRSEKAGYDPLWRTDMIRNKAFILQIVRENGGNRWICDRIAGLAGF
jgi:hypothetical protein